MLKFCVVLALAVATCYGNLLPDRNVCGRMPRELTSCLDLRPAVSDEIQEKCRSPDECERMSCLFREYNLFDGAVVNKERTATFLDDFAKPYPSWQTAIDHAKASCLRASGLKPQGVYLNCPAYDILHCVLTNLVKHALPSQWSTMSQCKLARMYAAACPICPDACFAPQLPVGSCNACSTVNRST